MLSKILLFLLSNIILITTTLTPSRILLLSIVSVVILKGYKYILNYDKIDKYTFKTSGQIRKSRHKKHQQMEQTHILSQILALLLQNNKKGQVWLVLFSIFIILVEEIISTKTMMIILFNLTILILIVRHQIKNNFIAAKTKLGIKHTSSYYLDQTDSPVRKLLHKDSFQNTSPTRKLIL